MKKQFFKSSIKLGILAFFVALSSCTKDLDRTPFVEVTSATVYKDFSNYKQILAKVYAGLAVSGQQGPAGRPDISGIDEGFSTYLRQYWKAQQLPTDEAVIGWNDGSLPDYHDMDWTSGNEFIRETSDAKLSDRGISGENLTQAKIFRAEARFLRALSYYHALDMYGSVPFVTEADAVGSFLPRQASRTELFSYVESELKAIENELLDARKNEYGRADKGAAWALLAKLYLNAETYIGAAKYTECITYCNKVTAASYALESDYNKLFLTDNNKSSEMIFPITFDGTRTKTWGGMTFLVHAGVGGNMNPADFGINGGWSGLRTTKAFVGKFTDITGATDRRAMFHTNGQKLDISDIFTFNDGYAITKYRNVSSTGVKGTDTEGNFPDTDFPMFRLADVYLMYAEATLRGGQGGSQATALQYVNALRQRAYKGTSGNVTSINLDFILDERARELYWEAHRRTDLIRFKKFTGSAYLWPWKGGVKDGRSVPDHLVLFPIPASDLVANPNLVQNSGY